MLVARGFKDKEPLETVFREIKEIIAKGPEIQSWFHADAATQYAGHRKRFGEELIGTRSWLGDDKFYEFVLDELRGNWPVFRKK